MTGFWKGTLAAALLLSLTAGLAVAEVATSPSISVGLNGTTVFDYHAMGFGAAFNMPFDNGRWAFNADARYQFGNYKLEGSSTPPTLTTEDKLSGYQIRAGLDRQIEVGPATMYCGSGVSYASHKIKNTTTGSPDSESEPYNVFGINSRLGSSVPLGANESLSLFGQFENTVGWGSIDNPYPSITKLTQTDVSNGYQMGLRYSFPGAR